MAGGASSLRPITWGILGAAAIGVLAVVYTERQRPGSPSIHPIPSVVYADATAHDSRFGDRVACTAEGMSTRLGAWVCTQWTILQQGQAARPAVDPGGRCGMRHVDQQSGRWVCDDTSPPDPDSLPNPAAAPPVDV